MTSFLPKIPALRSAFDLVAWLEARAETDGRRLPALSLQRILYIAQALYAAQNDGQPLIPGSFIAEAYAPIEANVYHAMEAGLPAVSTKDLPPDIATFMDKIWRHLAGLSADELANLVEADGLFATRRKATPGAELTLDAMADAYRHFNRGKANTAKVQMKVALQATEDSDLRPSPNQRIRFTADGRSVTKWTPTRQVGPPTIRLIKKDDRT